MRGTGQGNAGNANTQDSKGSLVDAVSQERVRVWDLCRFHFWVLQQLSIFVTTELPLWRRQLL